MEDCMRAMKIDMKKLPLGKLSRNQILSARGVLSSLQHYFNLQSRKMEILNPNIILDASNRFYTLIPHDTGLEAVAKLDNEAIIKEKAELLEDLLEIELAYTIIKKEENDELDPIDQSYAKLNTKMDVLDKNTPEFRQVLKYVNNTHGSTHNSYTLDIKDVYKVEREGERERYDSSLHNKKLLWHGSRLTNYVGILSQGLRIAPPEAPMTGYMFGKGVYFADMVSKSANYCYAHDKEGLLLLCEVALGNEQEERNANMITKLNPGKHSCKGLGQTYPDPKSDESTVAKALD
uniref:Poly [ADP-ribose] polymerase n=1 Tax=Steinernema glaseri TaxID=37863 RepID=A0A1I8AKG4_9BILA